jgi:hypothetical protein
MAISASQFVVLVGASALVATRQPRGGRLLTLVALFLLAVVAVGLVIQMVGNQRVAASIWQTDYGDGLAWLVPPFPGSSQATSWPAGATGWCGWAAWPSPPCWVCSGGCRPGWR